MSPLANIGLISGQGSVALTIADEAYSVALYIAFDNSEHYLYYSLT